MKSLLSAWVQAVHQCRKNGKTIAPNLISKIVLGICVSLCHVMAQAAPTVSIFIPRPIAGEYTAPSTINMCILASEPGSSIAKVDLYNGDALIGSYTNLRTCLPQVSGPAGTNVSLPNLGAGTYQFIAKATDAQGVVTVSATSRLDIFPPSNVSGLAVVANQDSANAPANVTLGVLGTNRNKPVDHVEYFNGTTSIGTVPGTALNFVWANVASGTYTINATVTFLPPANGLPTPPPDTAAPVTVTVGTPPPGTQQAYFIETDQLDTPRVITDAHQNTVWQWDNAEPFGNSLPNQDPRGTGRQFVFNPRFAGQYFDQETGLHYNYFRDYDPRLGRYVESDPIGQLGGINSYIYVNNGPLKYNDSSGLCPFCPAIYVALVEWGPIVAEGAVVVTSVASGVPMPETGAVSFTGRTLQAASTDVYLGIKDGKAVYVGITKDVAQRACQHGDRFDSLQKLTSNQLARDQARAIEQSVINRNPQFQNQINSIARDRSWYQEAIDWGEYWLKSHGL